MLHVDHVYQKSITFIGKAENFDTVMPVHNLFGYSDNYSMTSGSLWNHCRHEMNDDANENNADIYRIDNSKTVTSESFEYKTKVIYNT